VTLTVRTRGPRGEQHRKQRSLRDRGNAGFSGNIGHVSTPCNNPLFLVRIAQPAGAAGRWIATGAVRSFGARSLFYGN
jgi:hypothetical protein